LDKSVAIHRFETIGEVAAEATIRDLRATLADIERLVLDRSDTTARDVLIAVRASSTPNAAPPHRDTAAELKALFVAPTPSAAPICAACG